MGREVLYVVSTDIGHVRVLEQGSTAGRGAGEVVNINFDEAHALVFDAGTEKLIPDAHVRPPAA